MALLFEKIYDPVLTLSDGNSSLSDFETYINNQCTYIQQLNTISLCHVTVTSKLNNDTYKFYYEVGSWTITLTGISSIVPNDDLDIHKLEITM